MADYTDFGYDRFLRKKIETKKQYMSQVDTELFIEGIGQNKIKVKTDKGTQTIKEYVDELDKNNAIYDKNGNIKLPNSGAIPASNPNSGGYLYVENGALKYRGSSGTVTTIAPA